MATEMVAAPVTSSVEFCEIPVAGVNLFVVAAGVPASVATEEALLLEGVVSDLLTKGIGEEGMDADTAFICRFLLNASSALRQAVVAGK